MLNALCSFISIVEVLVTQAVSLAREKERERERVRGRVGAGGGDGGRGPRSGPLIEFSSARILEDTGASATPTHHESVAHYR